MMRSRSSSNRTSASVLAEALWQSIENSGDVEGAWAEEVKQRIAAADAGELDSTPWDQARDELMNELRQIRSRGR